MIRAVKGKISPSAILPNNNICLVHFLDLNINRTRDYLKLAWSAGSIGANHLYLVNIEDNKMLDLMNFTEIFDFQRLLISTPVAVRKFQDTS